MEQRMVHVRWPAEIPAQMANQFIINASGTAGPAGVPDGIFIAFGQVSPPMLVGTPEEQQSQLQALGGQVTAQVYGRFFLSLESARQLRDSLNEIFNAIGADAGRAGEDTS